MAKLNRNIESVYAATWIGGIEFELNSAFLDAQAFYGNADRNTVVKQELEPPIVARFLRIYPVKYNGRPALRLELYGCAAGQ